MLFFTDIRCLASSLCIMLGMMSLFYLDPILSVELEKLGVSEDNVGFVFALEGFAYGFGSPVVGYLCTKMHRTYVIQTCFVLTGIGLFFVGPSQLFGLPDKLGIILFGISLTGFAVSGIFVPMLPEISEAGVKKFKLIHGIKDDNRISLVSNEHGNNQIKKHRTGSQAHSNMSSFVQGNILIDNKNTVIKDPIEELISDKASAVFNMAFALGATIGPILGGAVYDWKGYRTTSDFMAILALVLSMLYCAVIFIPIHCCGKYK